jgi:hypothetical protein
MLHLVQDILEAPQLISGWVNGSHYVPTKEVSGVLPIPSDLRLKSGMGIFIPGVHTKQPQHYLAALQGTRKPVLPIHNDEERKLFRKLMSEDNNFTGASGPNWEKAVQIWNGYADSGSDQISYKVVLSPSYIQV